jgi:ATP-dependent helicase/nuclease subunit B
MPSALFETAKTLAKAKASSDAVLPRVWTTASLAWELARTGKENTEQAQTLRCLARKFHDERRLDAIKRSLIAKDHRLTLPQASRGLLGKRIRLSATRLESYYRCPFSFFVKDGLKFIPLRKAELTVAEAGTLMHHILAVLLDRYRGSALTHLTDAQLKTDIREVINNYISRRVKNPASLSARMRHNFLRQEEWAFELMDRLRTELKQSAFVPVAFELAIGEGKAIESPVFKTPEGEEIILRGSIDRVDIAELDDRRYVRVVDYKSGGKEFHLSDLCSGLNMQMLLYLFALCKYGKGDFENLLPAGVVYLPTLGKYFSAERSIAEDKLESEKNKHFKTSGLLLNDAEVLKGMGPMYERFIAKKSKNAGADALVSHSEMKKVEELVARKVVQMAQGFLTAEIPALPAEQKGKRACEYCDYRAVCGFEEGDPVRSIDALERSAVFGEVMSDE